MSFILDALRKSETERQRQSGPGLVDAGYRPPARRSSPWPAVVAVVLTANLALMAWYLLRDPAPAPATSPVAAEPAPAPPAASSAAPPPAARSLADAAGVAPPEDGPWDATADLPALDAAAPAAPMEPTATVEPGSAADSGTPAAPVAAVPPPAGSGRVADDLPSAAQVMESGAVPYKDLHLDIHVWSDKPEERFVFINMRKYGEGAVLPEGPRIDAITRDGVTLSQDGQRFMLTRD